ncbi:MAG: GNAT family N-acetyltransferase [Pseudomonadota bacterium]
MGVDLSRFEVRESLRDGSAIILRAIRPDDKQSLADGFAQLTPQAIHWRFFGAKAGLSEADLIFLTEIDYDRHMGLVAVDEEGQVVGVGRYVAGEGDRNVAELAFIVGEPFQGRGIASAMLCHLQAAARDHGLDGLEAVIQPDNEDMLDIFRRAGFAMGWDEVEGLRTATLRLTA